MNERDAEVIGVYAGHCLTKCANVVLSSRVFSTRRNQADERAKKWFSLAIEEVEPAAEELAKCRADPRQPITLQIFLRTLSSSQAIEKENPVDHDDVLLERWEMQYDTSGAAQRSPADSSPMEQAYAARMDKHSVYKKMVILTRSLYSYLRILPAYRLYRAGQNAQSRSFDIIYKISIGRNQELPSEDPQTQFKHFSFADLHTPSGALKIQVHYCPASMICVLEETTHQQSLPRIISDYISSPRQLHSLSVSVPKPTVVASAGPSTPGLVSNRPPLLHRHSWSSRDTPNSALVPSLFSTNLSPIAASPKPSMLNGRRHVDSAHKKRTRSYSALTPVESGSIAATSKYVIVGPSGSGDKRKNHGLHRTGSWKDEGCNCGPELNVHDACRAVESRQGRKVSAPVSIPGKEHKRMGSFQELSEAVDMYHSSSLPPKNPCVASAPAHVPGCASSTDISTSANRKDHVVESLLVSGSGSSFCSASSHQLPFAFSPLGFLSNEDQTDCFGMDPSPPISGRDISALALIRRPSWSSRSFDMSNTKLSDPLDPWLSSGSQAALRPVLPLNSFSGAKHASLSMATKPNQQGQQGMLTASFAQHSDLFHSFMIGSSESDQLPFALDGDGLSVQDGFGDGERSSSKCAIASTSAATDASSSQSDAAVVSFLRLMQDAPPLKSPASSPSVSLERAKAQLQEFKVKVEGFTLEN